MAQLSTQSTGWPKQYPQNTRLDCLNLWLKQKLRNRTRLIHGQNDGLDWCIQLSRAGAIWKWSNFPGNSSRIGSRRRRGLEEMKRQHWIFQKGRGYHHWTLNSPVLFASSGNVARRYGHPLGHHIHYTRNTEELFIYIHKSSNSA